LTHCALERSAKSSRFSRRVAPCLLNKATTCGSVVILSSNTEWQFSHTPKPHLKLHGRQYAMLKATPKTPKPTHVKRKTMSSSWSPPGSPSVRLFPPLASESQQNTPPYWVKIPSCSPRPAVKCNALTKALNPPLCYVRQPPRHNTPAPFRIWRGGHLPGRRHSAPSYTKSPPDKRPTRQEAD
jgi:hypothetical protein